MYESLYKPAERLGVNSRIGNTRTAQSGLFSVSCEYACDLRCSVWAMLAANLFAKALSTEDYWRPQPRQETQCAQKARVVGHDIGLMVAYAYAAQFPAETEKLVMMDAFLPGAKKHRALVSEKNPKETTNALMGFL